MPKVGASPVPIWVVTLGPGGPRHPSGAWFIRQIDTLTGRLTPPVSAMAVINPLAPRFSVTTMKAPTPGVPAMERRPSLLGVTANSMISGVGVDVADRRRVLTPGTLGAGEVLSPKTTNGIWVGPNAAKGVMATRNNCAPDGGMSTGTLRPLVNTLPVGSSAWKVSVAGRAVPRAIPTCGATTVPALRTVTKTVAGVATCTDRLLGRRAATRETLGLGKVREAMYVPHAPPALMYCALTHTFVGSTESAAAPEKSPARATPSSGSTEVSAPSPARRRRGGANVFKGSLVRRPVARTLRNSVLDDSMKTTTRFPFPSGDTAGSK